MKAPSAEEGMSVTAFDEHCPRDCSARQLKEEYPSCCAMARSQLFWRCSSLSGSQHAVERLSFSLHPRPAPPPPSAPLLPAPDKPSRFCRRKATCLFTYLRRGHCFFLRETHKHLGPGPLLRLPGSPFAPTPTQSTRAATGSRHLKGKRGRANQKNWKKSGTTSNEGQKQVLCTSEESLN